MSADANSQPDCSCASPARGEPTIQFLPYRAVRAKLISDEHIGCGALFLEQFAQEFHGGSLVAPSLHEHVENLAFVVNRAPEPELPPRKHHGHLVEMHCAAVSEQRRAIAGRGSLTE